jgi:hypothetical protein
MFLLELKAAVADPSKHCCPMLLLQFSETAMLPCACENCCYYVLAMLCHDLWGFGVWTVNILAKWVDQS